MTDDQKLAAAIEAHWNALTKPRGSLGQLEEMVISYGLIRGEQVPLLDRKGMYVFCGDHGVAAAGVSAYPQEVTRQMVQNFVRGGAAISVLCRHFSIHPTIVDAGVIGETPDGVVDRKIAEGTRNFVDEPAMTPEETERALRAGKGLAREASDRFDLVGVGEMGIGNTTVGAALLCAFADEVPEEAVGRGTGVDTAGWRRKVEVVRSALERSRPSGREPVAVLSELGGYEIAEMAGFLIGAAEMRLPVVLDGFIAGSAALAAEALEPGSLDTVLFSHRSAEKGHQRMLEHLGAKTYYDLDMRLGEGTGAALTINLLETAVKLYSGMATFDEAGVSDDKSE